MEHLNLEPYFATSSNQYYDPKYIIVILEELLNSKLDDIKISVNSSQVTVTKEDITKFLEKKFEEENPELKKRIESLETKRNIPECAQECVEDVSQEFADSLIAGRYYFEPYTLQYFNKYSSIVRTKSLLLLDIIGKIGNKDTTSIQDLLTDLDIQLDEDGNISKEDIVRLIEPTIYNIEQLNEKVKKANDLSTYLTFKMSKNSLMRDGVCEDEMYPLSSLQIKDLSYEYIQGLVPLSTKQIENLETEENEIMQRVLTMVIDL